MLQLLVVEGNSSSACAATKFPFAIGRSPASGLRLESPGVWETHASIFIEKGRFFVRPEGEGLLLVNDQRSNGQTLRMGDQLSIGATRVIVALAPALQARLAISEAAIWLSIGVVTVVQLLLLLWIS
jgi:predicted component of type VI protein secretion system